MNTKTTIILLIFFGMLLLLLNSYNKTQQNCPAPQTIYKYLPRTFDEEQNEPVYPSDIFKTMFSQQSPWVRSIDALDIKRSDMINNFFVSQY